MTVLLPPRPRLPRPRAHAKVKHDAEKRPSPTEARERPRYPALARGIARQEQAVHEAVRTLRRRWFAAVGLDDPAKGLKNVAAEDLQQLDVAIEAFLTTMAGPSRQSGFGFAQAPEGLVQETNLLAHRIGAGRGAAQVGNAAPNLELTRIQQQWMLERSFERLSDGSRLRFEAGLGEMRDRMVQGFADGESPLVLAKDLGEAIEGFESHWMRRIVRTEMAITSELAIREEYRAAGVRQFVVLGDPNTDALCVGYQDGGPYDLDNDDAMPPYHPYCFDTIAPYTGD